VTAVQLPLTSLQDDVATVKRAIALADSPLLLVGHSYGGVVITEAGGDSKVASLVFVAAFGPDVGESAGSLGAGAPPAPMGSEVRPDNSGFLKLTRKGVFEGFAHRVGEAHIVRCPSPDVWEGSWWGCDERGLENEPILVHRRDRGPSHHWNTR
jgi:pimeloyl-ACP methyl ester carboxylesterase